MDESQVLLDVNVLVYAVHPKDPRKAAIAERLVERSSATRQGVISYQVM